MVPVAFQIAFAILDFGNIHDLNVLILFVEIRSSLWPASIGFIGFASVPNWSL